MHWDVSIACTQSSFRIVYHRQVTIIIRKINQLVNMSIYNI